MKTIIEPFRIKSVEPIRMTTPAQRESILRAAGFNPFLIRADQVLIDLLTDSGTGAMSSEQWAGVLRADESYAGATSFYRFEERLRQVTGFEHILPTHQGRASERILFELLGGPGKVVPNNTHFDTTRANVEHSGAEAVDLPTGEGRDPGARHPFKGNMDVAALTALIDRVGAARIPVVMVTVTNNSGGGQPVSLANLRAVREVCRRHGIPLFLDACRFAENAWFIHQREAGQAGRPVPEIVREMFDLVDGATISAKKDGLVNIGGVLLLRNEALFRRASALLILTEGYVTYGGLAGRDLEAMAQGFAEVLDEDYLAYRIRSVEYLGERLRAAGVAIVEPPGGHAIYIDARAFCPHLPADQFPGQAVVCGLYRIAGIRAVEIGSVMFGGEDRAPPPLELVRLAIPRRVYTQSHIDYVGEAVAELKGRAHQLPGLRIVEAPAVLRHFTARFEEIEVPARGGGA
ncbi:MAG TPA: tryptophanase [Gemmatimonadales bacterium]|nr:tryptophanase [Gemmatimonadales bacterium]